MPLAGGYHELDLVWQEIDYYPPVLARCTVCGEVMFEMRRYDRPVESGRKVFWCLEDTCQRRYHLEYGELVSMKADPC